MSGDEAAYRAAMASDDPDEAAYGALNLGSLLASQGRFTEAETALRVAIDSENAEARLTATRYLAMALTETGRYADAERAFRQVVDAGHPFESGAAAVNLAGMLQQAGRLDDAEAALRTAMESADAGVVDVATGNLANLQKARGDHPDKIESTYRSAIDSPDLKTRVIAQTNLAQFLIERERRDEAETLLREAIDGGQPEITPLAASELGRLLMDSSRREEAETVLRQAMDTDDQAVRRSAAVNLGVTLRDLDRPREAEDAFRVAAGMNDAAATMELARLLEQRGESGEAVELYRTLAEQGSHPLYIEAGTKGLNRLLGTSGAEPPGVAGVMAARDAIVRVLRRHGALFAYLDHRPSSLSSVPRTDRTVAAWFAPNRPIPDAAVVEAQMPSAVDKVEVLNRASLDVGDHIGRTGRLIFEDDRPARIGWLADIRMVTFDQTTFTRDGRPRTLAVDFLAASEAPPPRLGDMLRFVRTHRQAVLDATRRLRQSPLLLNDMEALTQLRNVFFAAVVGCTRIAHIVIADNDWEPEGLREFDTLVGKRIIPASVAEALKSAKYALDTMIPMATPQQVLDTCFDPRYTDSIKAFVDGVEKRAGGRRRRWRRRK
ncbi:MAG: tetratricopeptide repeat protein [Guyparkeria sp.]